jgi:hypothetical protein
MINPIDTEKEEFLVATGVDTAYSGPATSFRSAVAVTSSSASPLFAATLPTAIGLNGSKRE